MLAFEIDHVNGTSVLVSGHGNDSESSGNEDAQGYAKLSAGANVAVLAIQSTILLIVFCVGRGVEERPNRALSA